MKENGHSQHRHLRFRCLPAGHFGSLFHISACTYHTHSYVVIRHTPSGRMLQPGYVKEKKNIAEWFRGRPYSSFESALALVTSGLSHQGPQENAVPP